MKAARVSKYGSPDVIEIKEMPMPEPVPGQIRVGVKAAGVGPWDALIREGRSGVPQTLPLTLGSDVAGIVDSLGKNVSGFRVGDEVYGLTNPQFTGAYAEYCVASDASMASKPKSLNFIDAASAPVVAVTAWQMLFDYGHAVAGQKVLVQGGAGNVGAYAVQLARNAGLQVIATASSRDIGYVKSLGASEVLDYQRVRIENAVSLADIVLDTVGGETRERSLRVLKKGGILVSTVPFQMPTALAASYGVKAVSFFVDVTAARLQTITGLFDSGKLKTQVGTVLHLKDARLAHEMLGGAPHERGKIVLNPEE
jgi:NADPH:quinone reductase-like Zn-dependent oxidoreductase